MVLDLGATPIYAESIRASTVFISHGHLDHVGAIFSHARAHAVVCSGNTATYYVPEAIRPQLERARDAMFALDGDQRPTQMNIVGVRPGDEVQLGIRGLFCRVFGVHHRLCPAVGYVIGSRLDPVLKEEYHGLDKTAIHELISKGVDVKTGPKEVLEVSYTGDTSLDGLLTRNVPTGEEWERRSDLYLQQAFQCGLLLCEATFLDDSKKSKDLSRERGHLHIDDIVQALEEHKFTRGDKLLVLLHISDRYSAKAAMSHIADALPSKVANRCLVAISSHFDYRARALTHLVQDNGCMLLSDYIALQNGQN
jgi:ribonuclease Z